MAINFYGLGVDPERSTELALRWDDSTPEGYIDFVEEHVDPEGQLLSDTLLRCTFREAAALAYIIANGAGNITFTNPRSIVVRANDLRKDGDPRDLKLEVYLTDGLWADHRIQIPGEMTAAALYKILKL